MIIDKSLLSFYSCIYGIFEKNELFLLENKKGIFGQNEKKKIDEGSV